MNRGVVRRLSSDKLTYSLKEVITQIEYQQVEEEGPAVSDSGSDDKQKQCDSLHLTNLSFLFFIYRGLKTPKSNFGQKWHFVAGFRSI